MDANEAHIGPTAERERHVILDALRGFALLGIALANYPEFALWSFLSLEEQSAMPSAALDHVVRLMQYAWVDGKFYTIFSLLFGVGFSLILARHGVRLFVRRMVILALIGLCHLMLLWSGDILLLYAVGGLLLPLFLRLSDRALVGIAALLIALPVGLDALTETLQVDFASPFYDAWWASATAHGITEENFATWLRDAQTYRELWAFLVQGAHERLWELVSGHRLPKVLGLFILGYLIGRHRLYARLADLPLGRVWRWTTAIGLPMSLLYAWSATEGRPWGLTVHSLLYAVSVLPMACSYIATTCLLYVRHRELAQPIFALIAASGRMALTNYISQSIIGIILFYGLGFGLGTTLGLTAIELTATAVFCVQIVFSLCWLRYFTFGPLEWLWRMLTYGRHFKIRRQDA